MVRTEYIGNNVNAVIEERHVCLISNPTGGPQSIYLDKAALKNLGDIIRRFLNEGDAVGKRESKVGCEGTDGMLRVHGESETCDVCVVEKGEQK